MTNQKAAYQDPQSDLGATEQSTQQYLPQEGRVVALGGAEAMAEVRPRRIGFTSGEVNFSSRGGLDRDQGEPEAGLQIRVFRGTSEVPLGITPLKSFDRNVRFGSQSLEKGLSQVVRTEPVVQKHAPPDFKATDDNASVRVRKKQPVHMTDGIYGPADTNRFALTMDFDMTVLWVAAWYRRTRDEREKLLNDLRSSDELLKTLGSTPAVWAWVSEIEAALNVAMPENAKDPKPLSLKQISALIKNWNGDKKFLRGKDGDDLLDQIGNRWELIDHLILLLADEQGMHTIFTTDDDVSPGWTVLNFLRYWTVLGREKKMRPRVYGPRESREFLYSWMETDPVATEQ